MIPISRAALYGLLLLNLILSLAVINLSFFANQGKRYTAADGDQERVERVEADIREREERMQADRDITARIDNLHPHTWPAQ